MSNIDESADPHGYRRLKDFLVEVEVQLKASGNEVESQFVHQAGRFFGGGSRSEFLGESRIALSAVLQSACDLPAELRKRIRTVLDEIDEGFEAVGGG